MNSVLTLNAPIATKSSAFLVCYNVWKTMENSVDRDQTAPIGADQTAPIGAVCSGSTLFASILNLSVMLGNYIVFAADNFSRRHFQMHF